MYFSKLCCFTKVIRSFSFSVKIPLEAQTTSAFMEFEFLQLFAPVLCMNSHLA